MLDAIKVAGHALAGRRHGGIQIHHGAADALGVLRKRILHRDHNAKTQVVHPSPLGLFAFKIKLPRKGLDELAPDL